MVMEPPVPVVFPAVILFVRDNEATADKLMVLALAVVEIVPVPVMAKLVAPCKVTALVACMAPLLLMVGAVILRLPSLVSCPCEPIEISTAGGVA